MRSGLKEDLGSIIKRLSHLYKVETVRKAAGTGCMLYGSK